MRQTTIFAEDDGFEDTEVIGSEDTADPTVEISLRDLQEAALDEVISPMQATQLWLRFSAGAVPIHRISIGPEREAWHAHVITTTRFGPGFVSVNGLYFLGGLAVLGATTLGWVLGYEALGIWGLLALGAATLVGTVLLARYFTRQK